jgi:GT2 family glycosyltransferase/tRNA A-37 threonylcarbamoyl transferase component Bud32
MLSIIIVTMGDSDLLESCVSSIRDHVGLPHEIILVNNSPQELKYSAEGTIRCLENGRNMGFARAVNRGIRAANGDKILLLNPDACFISDITTEMAAFLDSHEHIGIVGPQLVFPDGSLQNSIDIIPNLATEFLNKSLLKILFPEAYPSKRSRFTGPVRVPSVIGACMMMKRGLIDAIGPLDEGFFLYLEETDFCKRTNNAGFEVWHLPHLKVVHHQGIIARQFDIRRKIEYQRSMYRFFRKHKGPFQGVVLYLFSLVKLFIEMGGSAPSSVSLRGRHRLKKLFMVLLWHLMGMPPPWGLEKILPPFKTVRKNGYTWFIPNGADIPVQAAEPKHFMETFGDTVLNKSRTTFVKSGMLGERQIFLKRYNFKGLKDTIKNLFRKSRARRSFEAALMLGQAGIPTPPVVFACEKRICGILLESYIATEKIDASDLVGYVSAHGHDARLILLVAGHIRRLHEMGFIPVDLKGENLLAGDGTIHIIDLDRLKRMTFHGLKTIAKNLSYLNASFCNVIPRGERNLFLEEYVKGNPLLQRRKKELAGRIKDLTLKRIKERYSES